MHVPFDCKPSLCLIHIVQRWRQVSEHVSLSGETTVALEVGWVCHCTPLVLEPSETLCTVLQKHETGGVGCRRVRVQPP
jgi:hypothetical protein